MPDKAFIDTNVLIYSYSIDEPLKSAAANRVLDDSSNNIISSQVISELSNILFKKFKLTSEEIENVILEVDNLLPIVGFDITTQVKAIRLKNKYKLQFYDSLIIATALENGCNILFSEDMQHLQVIDNTLTIINPFVTS